MERTLDQKNPSQDIPKKSPTFPRRPKSIPVLGRSLVTYSQQFNFDIECFKKEILKGGYFLDCGSGLCRFAMQCADELLQIGFDMNQNKGGIISVDNVYNDEPNLRHVPDLKQAAQKSFCINGDMCDLSFFKDNFFTDTFFSYILNAHSSNLGKAIHFLALEEAIRVTKRNIYIYPLDPVHPELETKHASPDGPVLHEIKLIDGLSELKRARLAKKISYFADLTFQHFNSSSSPVRPEIYKITSPIFLQSYERQHVRHYGMVLRKKQNL